MKALSPENWYGIIREAPHKRIGYLLYLSDYFTVRSSSNHFTSLAFSFPMRFLTR